MSKPHYSSNVKRKVADPIDEEFGSFEQYTKGIGSKLMQKMGYNVGEGLGVRGGGIVNPIETKLRPGKLGLAYGGFQEKVQSEEEKQPEITAQATKPKKNAWKAKAKRPKVEYKTAEEIITGIEEDDASGASIKPMKIIDMTGPTAREITSTSQISSSLFAQDAVSGRLPELRYNLRLIVDMSQSDLEHIIREQRIQKGRIKSFDTEQIRVEKLVHSEANKIKRLNEIMGILKECERLLLSILSSEEDQEDFSSLQDIYQAFDKLQTEYEEEYSLYGLDSAVVAIISPLIKRSVIDWDPLSDPTTAHWLEMLKKWQRLLKTSVPINNNNSYGSNGDRFGFTKNLNNSTTMTPYESMMYNIWLPKVRSAINNFWSARKYEPVIKLLENWNPPTLPTFIYDNILVQLIFPKLEQEVDNWNPKKDKEMIHHWVHPWLLILQERLEPLYVLIRQKFVVALQAWHPSDSSAFEILYPWKTVFKKKEMQSLLLKSVLPKLATILRTELQINPKQQDIKPFKWVMEWYGLFSAEDFGQLFATEFFPKWLDILHVWLTHNPNYDEVNKWCTFWNEQFPPEMAHVIESHFIQALDMIDEGSALGVDSAARLRHPSEKSNIPEEPTTIPFAKDNITITIETISHKDIIEDFAQEHNYLFLPVNKTHAASGKPLFRFGCSLQGVGGVLLYMKDDVMYAQEESKQWVPIGFDELLEKAERLSQKDS
ncbi:11481_t:CDS:2 [Ambispora gerdemannii]|uniref:11481_t:CDS:1 n=1 Tax=Ambispora gerdemannii TaxID=144530 RepID=A0A9N8W7G1_9GLOM|nr:11481_t:CDS:2 [Ambispora gerdemannii]